jgi:hypothetical protein
MATENSRYAMTIILTRCLSDGREVAYLARRFIPDAAGFEIAGKVRVQAGERSDLIAARAYGDASTSWRIADGNRSMDLTSLTEVPDRILDIPLTKPDGEVT